MAKFLILVLIQLHISAIVFADTAPIAPAPGVDTALLQGKSVADFFAARKADPICQSHGLQDWQDSYAKYLQLKSDLQKMIKSGASTDDCDAKESDMLAERKTLIGLTDIKQHCGPCAAEPVQYAAVNANQGPQKWFVTDGSCYLPPAPGGFDKAVNFLSNTGAYARQNGGFDAVLDFYPIDPNTGAQLPDVSHVDISKPLTTFVAVQGLSSLVIFDYVCENKFQMRKTNGLDEFIITFKTVQWPDTFDPTPTVNYVTLAGTNEGHGLIKPVDPVQAMWYARSDGYYRYYTAANFGSLISNSPNSKDHAVRTLLDAVLTAAERGIE